MRPSVAKVFLRERYSSEAEHPDWTIHEEGLLQSSNFFRYSTALHHIAQMQNLSFSHQSFTSMYQATSLSRTRNRTDRMQTMTYSDGRF